MAQIKVPTSFNIDVEFEVPEFYRRLVALLIDLMLLWLYTRLAEKIFFSSITGYDSRDDYAGSAVYAFYFLIYLPIFIYFPIMEMTTNGQSLGKKIMGLRIINERGGKPNISQFLIRSMIREIWFAILLFVSLNYLNSERGVVGTFVLILVVVYFFTDLILVISSNKGQRLGDLLARTILVRTNSKASIDETIFQEVADSYKPSFPSIMRLSDRDINAIKSILETARKRGDYDMALAAMDKIKNHLGIESSMSPYDFLDILLKDYNYLSTK